MGGLPPVARPRALLARGTHRASSSPRASGGSCSWARPKATAFPAHLHLKLPRTGPPSLVAVQTSYQQPHPARASPAVHTRRKCHPRLFQAQGTGDRGLSEPPAASDTDGRRTGTIALWSSGRGKPGALTSVVPGRRRQHLHACSRAQGAPEGALEQRLREPRGACCGECTWEDLVTGTTPYGYQLST